MAPARPDVTLEVTCDPRSVSAARAFAVGACRGWRVGEACDIIELLVSKIVTNAVVHSTAAVRVRLRQADGRVRVDVFDGCLADLIADSPGPHDEHGRGLVLLDALATRWGVDQQDNGSSVWFEIETSGTAAAM